MIKAFHKLKSSKYYLLALSVLSGLLLWLGWPTFPTPFLLFFAFVPLLEIERVIAEGNFKWPKWTLFMYTYLTMVIWNAGTTWWISLSDPESGLASGLAAVLANSVLMTLPFFLFRITRRNIDDRMGYLSFICFWMTFEYVHLNWDLSWPWLTLGNGFAMFPEIVQWYDWTGILGGSLWILIINIYIYLWLRDGKLFGPQKSIGTYIQLAALVILPIAYSLVSGWKVEVKTGKGVEIVAVQPNVDPINDKFDQSKYGTAIENLIGLSEEQITDSTDYVVWPETALQGWCDYDALEKIVWPSIVGKQVTEDFEFIGDYSAYYKVMAFLKKYPHVTLLTGISTQKFYRGEEKVPSMAHVQENFTWQSVNAGAQLDTASIALYKKSKLVIGAEKIPYPFLFEPFIKALDIHGAAQMATQAKEEVFFNRDSVGVAPVICYESVYGEYLGEFVKSGAQLIVIMTNDGWWGATDGHRHHKAYATLRAIETRRDIARSANTGISCFINKKGEISHETKYWVPASIRSTLYLNDAKTFYVKHGDYLGRLAYFLGLVLLLSGIVKRKTRKIKK